MHCEFSFTFCQQNVGHFEWVQDFAHQLGTKAYICWTVMNERFDVKDDDLMFWQPGIEEELLESYLYKSLSCPRTTVGRLAALATMSSGITFACLYDSIINRRIMPCYAGSKIVHVDPDGNVFPCNFKIESRPSAWKCPSAEL